MKTLRLVHDSPDSLVLECEKNLYKARAFVPGASGLDVRERCTLHICVSDSNAHISVEAEAVWIDTAGVGLELVGLDSAKRAELESFVRNAFAHDVADALATSDDTAQELGGASGRIARNLYERIRGMSSREREDSARHGALAERVALERTFAGSVWEGLLQNPQLTPPEVARIARNGTLPKPLIATIVSNAGWLTNSEVQRALLSNPRCSGPQLERVLRAMPSSELVRLTQHCPYRAEVRAAANRLAIRR